MKLEDYFVAVKNKYDQEYSEILKNIDDIPDGESQDGDFLYFRGGSALKIYDRVCDHGGGKLSLKEGGAVCPLHGWRLDLKTGAYTNAGCRKEPILTVNEHELDSPLVSIPLAKYRLAPSRWNSQKRTEIRFINHACLVFKMGDITFATDPWIYGSAFCNGWLLDKPSPVDAFNALNECDFIYISHNHPDHLHPESLEVLRKDMPILTGNFASGSTAQLLLNLGFENVTAMDFGTSLVDSENELRLSVLKSGDFRDDSGLFVQFGKFKCLLTVDSNFLDFGRLPPVDLLCSSFAGGASGFPLCFDNYSEEEKKVVVTRNLGAIKATNISNIKATNPCHFLPYAGFFREAERDEYIRKRNAKNTVEDYQTICESFDCSLLNVNDKQFFEFEGSQLVCSKEDQSEKMDTQFFGVDPLCEFALNTLVLNYFSGCTFQDELLVDLRPTCVDFVCQQTAFKLDFFNSKYCEYECRVDDESVLKEAESRGLRYLRIRVREQELRYVLINGKPWEDLSIGFQCRIFRSPNVYNSEFWSYFTNVYIGKRATNAIAKQVHE